MKSRSEISAGGIVYRHSNQTIEVLICKDAGYHRWILPKGLVRKHESYEETALREVREEVGVEARIVQALGEPEKYVYTARNMRVFKSVYYFLMEYVSDSPWQRDAEMEEVKWVSLAEAIDLIAYPQTRALLKRCQTLLENGVQYPGSAL
jgi:8-oxo-dGTP pyrophosphatase MutT (NUDIX family)